MINDTLIKNSIGILYYCAKGTSGYAEAAKRMLCELVKQRIPISCHQIISDSTTDDELDITNDYIKDIINKNIDFDTVIFHCTPDVWFSIIDKYRIKFIGKKLIGYTTWETSKLPEIWVKYINLMDEVWVPCSHNKRIFEFCGVEVPIKIIPHPFIERELPEINSNSLSLLLSNSVVFGDNKTFKYGIGWKVFYTIGELNDRKNIEGTIKTFCESFTKYDKVKLIVKTFYIDYSSTNKRLCREKVKELLSNFKNHPEILLITENISRQEINLIHSVGDCFFSMTRGEGFCLDAFDAFKYGKSVLITGYGGHLDYLGENYEGLIDYKLINVDFKERESLYNKDQKWADPNTEITSDKLKKIYSKPKKYDIEFDIPFSNYNFLNEMEDPAQIDFESNLKINLTNIEIKNESEFSGIIYIGQFGTSGYATAAKGNLYHFFSKGIPISWIPLYFDNSKMSDDCFYNAMIKSLINKNIDNYNTVFLHSTPDIWPELIKQHEKIIKNKKLIGYTVWETSKLPEDWVDNINSCVNEVWCPSTYNKFIFESSGVKIPINVFPHIFLKKELPNRNCVFLKTYDGKLVENNNYYTFYNISELNPRKGVEDLIKVFCESFTENDKVRLILKIHYKNYEDKNKKICINKINDIISNYKTPPLIYFLLNNLSEKEILGLHSMGNCYISLCKSEGFGLTIFEAFKYGRDVITTGYGGQLDFLGETYKGLVKYSIGDVAGMEEFSTFYLNNQKWAYPDLEHAKSLIKSIL